MLNTYLFKNKKGMTLIEVVVAFAIVAVISVVIVIGFNTMGSVMNEGSTMSRLDQELERQIAMSEPTDSITPNVSIDISGGAFTINGSVKEYTLEENGTQRIFRIFVAE